MSHAQSSTRQPSLHWSQLPNLPDKEGFAAMHAGVSGGALLVAGGANFPEKRPWEGGTKIWYDDIWVLDKPDGQWRNAGKLPKPIGYGVSVTWKDEVICAGGSNAEGHRADVYALKWEAGKVTTRTLPSLPQPFANTCGVLIGDTLYVAGGIDKPDATKAMHTFWSLNLADANANATWQTLPPWPGPERMLATAGTHDGAFYLFTGAALHADKDGKPARDWLKDAYRFTPGKNTWEKLPDVPQVAVAACTPAPSTERGLLLLCGDDGSKVGFKPETEHPGFPKGTLLFDVSAGDWHRLPDAPISRATVPTTIWNGRIIIPSGEARPGFRSPEVWSVEVK
ncbi:galactose oxidase [Roseimicrobium sp. ORNL1]|uniref:galactose oxidase n=1 Tax=Roseimicrobium sp. ORNL1 TaxID=2711231 RepID=UPI0013E1DAEC|nr:galactose oxidase [Roseimicrobium sp. ORNL1]QIF01833.1 galactose oxidase [Roseimicrobium sp. ORNL1]